MTERLVQLPSGYRRGVVLAQVARRLLTTGRRVRTYAQHFGVGRGTMLALRDRGPRHRLVSVPPVGGTDLRVEARLGTTDLFVAIHVLFLEEYSIDLPRDPAVIVDAGANVGYTSVWFAHRYPGATILAIEPEPENFEMLQRNVARYDNIRPIHGALWSESGTVSMAAPNTVPDALSHRVGGAPVDGVGYEVPAYELSDLLAAQGIEDVSLLKVDIEGAELEVFRDPSWLDRVDAIAIELHDRMRPGCARTFFSAIGDDFPLERLSGETLFVSRAAPVEALGTER